MNGNRDKGEAGVQQDGNQWRQRMGSQDMSRKEQVIQPSWADGMFLWKKYGRGALKAGVGGEGQLCAESYRKEVVPGGY